MNWLKKDCEPYREMISALLDGELNEVNKLLLQNHMKTCEDCSMLCVAFAAADGLVGESMAEPPAAVHRNVMKKVNQAARNNQMKRVQRMARPILAAAACVVLVVGGVLLLRPRGGSAPESAMAPQAEAYSYSAAASQKVAVDGETGSSNDAALFSVMEDAAGDVAAEEVTASDAGWLLPSENTNTAAARSDSAAPAEAPEAPTPEPAPESVEETARADVEDTLPTEAPETEEPAAAEPEPEPEPSEGAMTLELNVIVSRGDGQFIGTVNNDPTGLLSPGTSVTVLLGDILPPKYDSIVIISFDSLTGTPNGWVVQAKSMSFIR